MDTKIKKKASLAFRIQHAKDGIEAPLPGTLLLHGIPQELQRQANEVAKSEGFDHIGHDLEHILERFLFHVSFDTGEPFRLHATSAADYELNETTIAAIRQCHWHPETLIPHEEVMRKFEEGDKEWEQRQTFKKNIAPDDLFFDCIADWEVDLICAVASRDGYTLPELVCVFLERFVKEPEQPFAYPPKEPPANALE